MITFISFEDYEHNIYAVNWEKVRSARLFGSRQCPKRGLQGELSKIVISPDNLTINEDLREGLHTAALTERLEHFIGIDGFKSIRNG